MGCILEGVKFAGYGGATRQTKSILKNLKILSNPVPYSKIGMVF
jgi:hypothetical protein